MKYVLVDGITKCQFVHPRTKKIFYNSYRGALAARTRLFRTDWNNQNVPRMILIMSEKEYSAQVPMKTVKNLMSGKEVKIPADTPRCLDPSSELYWSM